MEGSGSDETVDLEEESKNSALETIQGYAENDDASDLTVEQLETAGAFEANGDRLRDYKDAVADKNSITNTNELQQVVDQVNGTYRSEVEALDLDTNYGPAEGKKISDVVGNDFKVEQVATDINGKHYVTISGTVYNLESTKEESWGYPSRDELNIVPLKFTQPEAFSDSNEVKWPGFDDEWDPSNEKELSDGKTFTLVSDLKPVLDNNDDKVVTFGINWKGNENKKDGYVEYELDFSGVSFEDTSEKD